MSGPPLPEPPEGRIPVARLTLCTCGHEGIAHYDSHLFCTYSMEGECDCEKFEPAGPEVIVDVRSWHADGAPILAEEKQTGFPGSGEE